MDAKFFMKPIHLTNSQIINLVELLVDYKFDEQEKVGTKYILKIKHDLDFDSGFHFILEYRYEDEDEGIIGVYEGKVYDTSYETDVPNGSFNVNVNNHGLDHSTESLHIDIKGIYDFLSSIGYWESKEIELEYNIDILPRDYEPTKLEYKTIYTSNNFIKSLYVENRIVGFIEFIAKSIIPVIIVAGSVLSIDYMLYKIYGLLNTTGKHIMSWIFILLSICFGAFFAALYNKTVVKWILNGTTKKHTIELFK